MKKLPFYFVLIFVGTALLSGFDKLERVSTETEFELLLNYLEENGDFINSSMAPVIISAEELKSKLGRRNLVIDIRNEGWYEYGHIRGAKNIPGPELLSYFQNDIDPTKYDDITIACYSGQSAAYYASLLRLAGYNNVNSLKWGMSSWSEDFAQNIWIKNSKDEFAGMLEKTANPMPEKGAQPIVSTGKIEAKDILMARIEAAFLKPYKEFIVKTPDVMENPNDFFIVNYTNEDRYTTGHLPGAVLYQPNKSLHSTTDLFTLPTDKKIVLNCDSGQNAAYAVAYLHILGYDVANLAYGCNSYMNSTMVANNWTGFSADEIKNYTYAE